MKAQGKYEELARKVGKLTLQNVNIVIGNNFPAVMYKGDMVLVIIIIKLTASFDFKLNQSHSQAASYNLSDFTFHVREQRINL